MKNTWFSDRNQKETVIGEKPFWKPTTHHTGSPYSTCESIQVRSNVWSDSSVSLEKCQPQNCVNIRDRSAAESFGPKIKTGPIPTLFTLHFPSLSLCFNHLITILSHSQPHFMFRTSLLMRMVKWLEPWNRRKRWGAEDLQPMKEMMREFTIPIFKYLKDCQ